MPYKNKKDKIAYEKKYRKKYFEIEKNKLRRRKYQREYQRKRNAELKELRKKFRNI